MNNTLKTALAALGDKLGGVGALLAEHLPLPEVLTSGNGWPTTDIRSGEPAIRLADPDTDNGLAHMLASLMKQNAEERPYKKAMCTSIERSFTIIGRDLGLVVTLECTRAGGIVLHDGAVGTPHIIIIADSETLLELTTLRFQLGVPVFDDAARNVVGKLRNAELVIKGAALYALDFTRLGVLLSVNC